MDDNIVNIAELFMTTLIAMAPRDNLNLLRSIGYKVFDDNTVEIIIGSDKVQYAPYTNEPWIPPVNLEYFPSGRKRTELEKRSLKSFRTGGKNPNEAWVERAINQTAKLLAEINLGVVMSDV
mgnify:CR=1 FL=1|jgi:hypothetical protein